MKFKDTYLYEAVLEETRTVTMKISRVVECDRANSEDAHYEIKREIDKEWEKLGRNSSIMSVGSIVESNK